MVARYAPPVCYNFLNLIRLGGDAKTTFEEVNYFSNCFLVLMYICLP